MTKPVAQAKGASPTKQHSMKCPKLYGKKCMCDGYHTFDELYEHRIALFITLCNMLYSQYMEHDIKDIPWKSKLHSDGTSWEGWFVAGIGTKKGKQITYHLPIKDWDSLRVVAYDKAPEWDGHTSEDVLERIKSL